MTKDIKRVLLKLSGENLSGEGQFGINSKPLTEAALNLKNILKDGLQLAVVIGGGNLFRGINLTNDQFQRSNADQIGMLATLMNGLALQQALKSLNCPSKIFSALDCPKVVTPFYLPNALNALENGEIALFVGGTGNPYFTTDSAAALRACEISADLLLKATKVDGVFDKDPKKFPDAKQFKTISYEETLTKKLQVMDGTAIALCRENNIPVYVFNMNLLEKQGIKEIFQQQKGTLITGD